MCASNTIIMPPTPEILAVCESIDSLIESYLRAFGKGVVQIGRFEAEVEAYTLQKLVIRHAEAITVLGRHDLVFLPTAHVAARAAFEAHLKIMWMLNPVDPFEQEERWIAHLKSAIDHWTKLSKGEHFEADIRQEFSEQAAALQSFADEMSSLLIKQGYSVSSKTVSIWDMLKELDKKQLYSAYVVFSAYTHSNFEAASLFKKNLGTGKELGEFITPAKWAYPLEATWHSLLTTSRKLLTLVEAPTELLMEDMLGQQFRQRINALRVSV